MSRQMYVVYCHTNKQNGKKYIGITSQKPEARWKNGEGYANNEHFYKSIRKYGWHNFSHEILYTDLCENEAEKMEVKLIAEYESYKPSKGYNIQLGGNVGNKFTEESKRKISDALRGKPKTKETREKLSMASTGRRIPTEQRLRHSEHMKGIGNPMFGKKRNITEYKTKTVKCVETGELFVSTCEASRVKGVDQGSISKACNGILKTAGGFHWKFAETEATNVTTG